jgi:uncharacterized protein YkwD
MRRGSRDAVAGREAIGVVVAAAFGMLVAAPGAVAAVCPHGDDVTTALSNTDRRASLLCAIGAERTARGLAVVRENPQLTVAAQRHADDMVVGQYFDHVSPAGTTVGDRVKVTGYIDGRTDWALGETIAWAQEPLDTAAGLVQSWLASPPHRAILLDGGFRDVGIGVARGLTDGSSAAGATAVLDFGFRSPSPTLPRWRSRSATACARIARTSQRKPARCASTSKRSKRSIRARRQSSTHSATTSKA